MFSYSFFTPDSGINLIAKIAGNACNINCKYCFEKGKDVSSKIMTVDTLKSAIDSIAGTCTIVFHGGEPLLVGIEHFEKLLVLLLDYYPHKVTAIRIQTNGTLLDNKWVNLLFQKYKRLNIEIAISLDGTAQMNALRLDYNGQPTFNRVRDAFKLLEDNGISAGMLSVISHPCLNFPEEYIALIESIPNLKFLKINALFNVENNKLTQNSITPIEYSRFIISTVKIYISKKLYKKLAIEPFLSILQRINHRKSRYCNFSNRKCFNYISLYPDGSIGPCDCFSIDSFRIPTMTSKTFEFCIDSYIRSEKISLLKTLMESCKECDIADFCLGGCVSQRYYFAENEKLLKDFCVAKHMLYDEFNGFHL